MRYSNCKFQFKVKHNDIQEYKMQNGINIRINQLISVGVVEVESGQLQSPLNIITIKFFSKRAALVSQWTNWTKWKTVDTGHISYVQKRQTPVQKQQASHQANECVWCPIAHYKHSSRCIYQYRVNTNILYNWTTIVTYIQCNKSKRVARFVFFSDGILFYFLFFGAHLCAF